MSLRPRIYPRPAQEASAHHQRTGAPKPGDQETDTNVARIFPSEEACLRLVTALAVETSEEWATGQGLPGYGASRGDGGSERARRKPEGGDDPARYRLISSPHLEGNLQNFSDATEHADGPGKSQLTHKEVGHVRADQQQLSLS